MGALRVHLPAIHTYKAATSPVPKIRAIHIRPVSNGLRVTHRMSNGGSQQFVFANPAKALTHLRRIQADAWLHPMQNPAPRTTHILGIGEEA